MFSDKVSCRFPHLLQIQMIRHKIRRITSGRIRHLSVQNMIFIRLYAVLIPRMPVFRNFFRFYDHDIIRQLLVHRIGDPVRRNRGIRIKYCHVSSGMHTGIGSARPDHIHLCPGQRRKRTVQYFFHGNAVWLHLPSAVIRSVISDRQFNAPHILSSP